MRYAVVFKTYAWDAFVHRQASRCEAAAGPGDFFVSIDETSGPVGPVPFDRVVRTGNAEIIALGFADRFEKGSLLWWNPDYVHYQFQERHPEYDYYVFVEYDVVVRMGIERLVGEMAARQADLIDLPARTPKQDWFWTIYHRQTYGFEELQGSLICLTAFSRRALQMLAGRRRAMAGDGAVRFWPMAEVFIPTEIARAGYRSLSLAEFGPVDQYQWFPPVLEDDLAGAGGDAVLHPVLDRDRYVAAMLRSTARFRSFLYPRSRMWRSLARFPRQDYLPMLYGAAYRRLRMSLKEKLQRRRLQRMFAPVAGEPSAASDAASAEGRDHGVREAPPGRRGWPSGGEAAAGCAPPRRPG